MVDITKKCIHPFLNDVKIYRSLEKLNNTTLIKLQENE